MIGLVRSRSHYRHSSPERRGLRSGWSEFEKPMDTQLSGRFTLDTGQAGHTAGMGPAAGQLAGLARPGADMEFVADGEAAHG
jgi:hypothetical protein